MLTSGRNLDREVVSSLGKRWKGFIAWGNEEKPRFYIYSRRDTDKKE